MNLFATSSTLIFYHTRSQTKACSKKADEATPHLPREPDRNGPQGFPKQVQSQLPQSFYCAGADSSTAASPSFGGAPPPGYRLPLFLTFFSFFFFSSGG